MNSIYFYAAILFFMAAAAFIDVKTKKIPNLLTLIIFVSFFVFLIFEVIFNNNSFKYILLDCFCGLFVAFSVSFSFYIFSNHKIGGGDVKLISLSGLYLGLSGFLPAILFTVLLFSATCLFALVVPKLFTNRKVPFAPFLLSGTAVSFVLTHFVI